MKLFDHLDALTIHKKKYDPTNDEQVKSYIPFMINRFVSMVDVYLPVVNEINMYSDIPKETHYRYYSKVLPKRKHFFKYIGKKKDNELEDKELIAEYYECSVREAGRYMEVMTPEQIKRIVSIYDHR